MAINGSAQCHILRRNNNNVSYSIWGRSNLFTASDLLTTNRIPSILDSFEVISLASTSDANMRLQKTQVHHDERHMDQLLAKLLAPSLYPTIHPKDLVRI